MEKASPANDSIVTTLVDVSPKQLREVANLLELSTQRVSGTETVLVKFTDKITFAYRPSQRVLEKLREVLDPKLQPSPLPQDLQ